MHRKYLHKHLWLLPLQQWPDSTLNENKTKGCYYGMQNDVKNLKMVHVTFFGSKNLVIVEEMLKKAGIEIVCGI